MRKMSVKTKEICINLPSDVGKVHGRILIECVRRITDGKIGKELCGFRTE